MLTCRGINVTAIGGATHEYCDSIEPNQESASLLTGIDMLDFGDGGSKADKFERDAKLLSDQIQALEALDSASQEVREAAWRSGLLRHKDILLVRCTFYLAQTWRDMGRLDLALAYYQKRAQMGGWEEEVWYALYQSAKLKEQLQYSEDEVIAAYLTAYQRRPQRAESLCNLARYLRERGRYALAYTYGLGAMSITETTDLLFVEKQVYQWQAKDEVAVSAYWIGQYVLAKQLNLDMLNDPSLELSQETRERLQRNIEACEPFL